MSHVYCKESAGWRKWRELQRLNACLRLLCICGSSMGLHAYVPTLSRSTVVPPHQQKEAGFRDPPPWF